MKKKLLVFTIAIMLIMTTVTAYSESNFTFSKETTDSIKTLFSSGLVTSRNFETSYEARAMFAMVGVYSLMQEKLVDEDACWSALFQGNVYTAISPDKNFICLLFIADNKVVTFMCDTLGMGSCSYQETDIPVKDAKITTFLANIKSSGIISDYWQVPASDIVSLTRK